MGMFEQTKLPILTKALDAYALRQRVIASNIANIQTQGYKAQEVTFEEQLTSALNPVAAKPISQETNMIQIGDQSLRDVEARVIDSSSLDASGEVYASGVNNVDIDKEMAEMAKNQIRYKFATRFLSETFRGIQKSIKGQL